MTPRAVPPQSPAGPTRWDRLVHARGTAVAAVWSSTFVISVWSPSLVSGAGHRHVPFAALTAWVWASIATGLLCFPGRPRWPRHTVATVVQAWAAAGFLASTSPTVVTSSLTVIPVTAIVAPALACLATAYAVLVALTGHEHHRSAPSHVPVRPGPSRR